MFGFCAGCVQNARPADAPPHAGRQIVVVPGAFGDGPWYDGLRQAVECDDDVVTTFIWGLPKPLFVGNFSSETVHDAAERRLADLIDAASGPVDIVAHSAGCGVVLGALARCRQDVGRVVLIAPSVSPTYDIVPSLARCAQIDAFVSDRDTLLLGWRCGTFGTYDRVRSPAAGFVGFMAVDPRLVQHFYDADWKALDHDGGHGGGTGRAFAGAVVRPLLAGPVTVARNRADTTPSPSGL